jgi:hypothetical protein
MDDIFDNNNDDFNKFINIHIYINGMILLEKEEDKLLLLKLNVANFDNYKDNNCNILQSFIENKIKKYIITKIKSSNINIVDFSRKNNIPIKNILYTFFINNKINNIDIIWSSSSIKEFKYVPIKHYLEHNEDTLILNTSKFKFKKSF